MALNLTRRTPPTVIHSPRLTLQRYRADDANALFEAASESRLELFPFMEWCHPAYDISDSHDWIARTYDKWQKKEWYDFAIWQTDSGRLLGGCGLNSIRNENGIANLGYWVRTSETRKGIATEATLALAAFAFDHLDLQRLEILMAESNLASKLVAEKAGAIYEGKLRNRLILHQIPTDAYLFSLIADDLDR